MKPYVMPEEEKAAFRKINAMPNFRAGPLTEYIGYTIVACGVCGIMKYGLLVIPGETRWKCQRCGKCCTGMDGKLQLPAELPKRNDGSCLHLNRRTKKCAQHDTKGWACRLWPFSSISDKEKRPNPIVVINSLCPGIGRGPAIDDEIYNNLQTVLMTGGQIQEAFKKVKRKR